MQNNKYLFFKFSTELKNILGRDLITNDYVAILELVKNSYDANASTVEIEFLPDKIIISDNGKGMSEFDIINKWLFVGFSGKRDGTEDKSQSDKDNYRNKIKRNYAGAKGIGRLSCDRLSQKVILTSRTKDSNITQQLKVNWSDFEIDQSKEMGNVQIPYFTFQSLPKFPENSSSGTILELSELHETWDFEKIQALRKSLEKMINPFSDVKDFSIIIKDESALENDKYHEEEISRIEKKENLIESDYKKISEHRNSIINGPVINTIAQILDIKTTKIESKISGDTITTSIIDRGEEIYKIEEKNKYSNLKDVTIYLYYLNRSAKFNFSRRMGIQPINYGSVFLFRNGFRILPYGNVGDDSWGLDRRVQQGYNRCIGTRDLFGRVDVETNRIDDFKEVSSREGGLIKTEATEQLFKYFSITHRRLERYVTGVLWGEGFLRNEYFKNQTIAKSYREELKEEEKDSSSIKHIYNNLGSKVDFLQLIRSLVNDENIKVISYNKQLADIVSDVSEAEHIQAQYIENFKQLAEKTNDNNILLEIEDFAKKLEELYKKQRDTEKRLAEEEEKRLKAEEAARIAEKQKEEAERKAEEERKAKELAWIEKKEAEIKRREAELSKLEAEKKAEIAEEDKKKAEKERDAQHQQNLYLSSVRDTSPEVEDLMHTVLIASTSLQSLVDKSLNLSDQIKDSSLKKEMQTAIGSMAYLISRVHLLSGMITKADINFLSENQKIDLCEYMKELTSAYSNAYRVEIDIESETPVIKRISVLDFTMVLENLISNACKAGATKIHIDAKKDGKTAILDISDNGVGVDLSKFTKDTIFEVGVKNRVGGSGIGLCTVKRHMKNDLNGDISFVGNGMYYDEGATFRLTFY